MTICGGSPPRPRPRARPSSLECREDSLRERVVVQPRWVFDPISRGRHATVTWPCHATDSETMSLNCAMILNQTAQPVAAACRASEDLRQALGQHGLAELVRNAIPPHPQREAEASESLLALLTYSYAAGVYDSAEIPRELNQHDLRCLLGAGVPADHHVLRQFRRHNRSELRECLSRVLRSAREPAFAPQGEPSWNWRPRGGHDGCDQEAEERINRAVRADTFALDD